MNIREAWELVLVIDEAPIGQKWILCLGHGESRPAETSRINQLTAIFYADNLSGLDSVLWIRWPGSRVKLAVASYRRLAFTHGVVTSCSLPDSPVFSKRSTNS